MNAIFPDSGQYSWQLKSISSKVYTSQSAFKWHVQYNKNNWGKWDYFMIFFLIALASLLPIIFQFLQLISVPT